MNYNGAIYRPPIEAETFLLPVTEGCTHNSCSFCNMYQGIPFRMLPLNEVEAYLQEVKKHYGRYCDSIQRVYLHRAELAALLALFFHALDAFRLQTGNGDDAAKR